MAKLILRKTLNGRLEPTDELARDALAKIPAGDLVMAEIKRARNPAHHKKFYALMTLIYQNQSRYKSLDELVDVIKVEVGHCEVSVSATGKEVYRPRSINWAQMDQTEFDPFYSRVVDLVLTRLLPHVTDAQLAIELEEFAA